VARPTKEGIDYSDWDVDIFEDPKIDAVMDAAGCHGFAIYFYLCQRVYATHGYYLPWSSRNAITVARRVGGGATAELVSKTVEVCLEEDLFSREIFEKHGVLTSSGIQKRFSRVIPKRTNKTVIGEYWLLPPEKSSGAVLTPLK